MPCYINQKIVIDLIPNVGLKDITFGMYRSEVREIMKKIYGETNFELRNEEIDCYFSNFLQFSYEKDNTLTFIEAGSPPPIFVTLLGTNTWEIPGDKLLTMLLESTNDKIIDISGSQIFINKHIALWGLNKDYDRIGNYQTLRWGAIGIGDERYYEKMVSCIQGE